MAKVQAIIEVQIEDTDTEAAKVVSDFLGTEITTNLVQSINDLPVNTATIMCKFNVVFGDENGNILAYTPF